MPINQNAMKADAARAKTFLASPAGVLLHELGHHAAANAEGVVPGHVIASGHSGGFRPLHGLGSIGPDCLAFMCAAGALAEDHFCGSILQHRLGPDLQLYVAIRPAAGFETRVFDIIEEWKVAYAGRVAELADCIEVNLDRCTDYVDRRRFLLGEHHIIPSAVLKLPHRRTWTGWLRERHATMGADRRRRIASLCHGDRVLRAGWDLVARRGPL